MKSAYFKELDRISFDEIQQRLGAEEEEVYDLIKNLEYNGHKIIKRYIDDHSYIEYSFNFVGIIMYKNFLIKCYPKYYNKNYTDNEKDRILKKVVQVLKKYGKSEKEIIGVNSNEISNELNYLSVIIFILNDFIENGLYTNNIKTYEINGEGEIDWDKTINEEQVYIVNNRPMYFNLITTNEINDDQDFIIKTHKYVINECSRMLEENGLLDILSYPNIKFEIDEYLFQEKEYVLNQIDKALSQEFSTRKQYLLKVLYSYFNNKQGYDDNSQISLFGTMSFNMVWEKTCAYILNNQLNFKIYNIDAVDKKTLNTEEQKKRLKDLIPFPYWFAKDDNKGHRAKKTIELDLISIFKLNMERYFIIWDAKYYNLILDKETLKNNPGVQDIIKQYIYNLTYSEFIESQKFNYSYNILLFPSEDDNIELGGRVDFEILHKALGVNDILILKMPSDIVFNLYLEEEYIKEEEIISKIKNEQ